MTADNVTPIRPHSDDSTAGNEDDGDAVLYFLRHTKLMDGTCFCCDDDVENGRHLLLGFAQRACARKSLPLWNADDCAAVVRFLSCLQPEEEGCFCNDTTDDDEDTNSTCGFHVILEHIAHSLRT